MSARSLDRLSGRLRRSFDTARLADTADADLLVRIHHDRDPAAFETLVRRHGPTVLAACRKILAEPADVDDAFQATFLTLLLNPGAVRNARALGSWLYGVGHRTALRAKVARLRRGRLHEKLTARGGPRSADG